MKKSSIIKMIAIAGAASLVMPLAACGTGSSSSNGKMNLTVFVNNTSDSYKPLISAFEKKYPKINVKLQTTTGAQAGYQQTLQTRISGGQLADVFIIPAEEFDDLVKNHLVRDLTNEPFMKNLGDENKKELSKDGKVYGVSISTWTNAMAYNKDLLKKAGYDKLPETWDEFIEMLKKLKEAGVKEPYLEAKAGLGAPIEAWIGNESKKAGEPLDQRIAEGKTTFAKVYGPLYKQWDRLITEGVMSTKVTGLADDQVRSEFSGGRVAVMPSGYWDVNTFNQAKINYSFGRYPMLHKGDTPFTSGGADAGYGINGKISGAELDAARKWMTFISSPEGAELSQKNLGSVPSTKNYDAKIDEHYKEPYDLYVKTGNVYLNSSHWVGVNGKSNLRGETYSQLQQVVLKQESPLQAAKNLDEKLATLK